MPDFTNRKRSLRGILAIAASTIALAACVPTLADSPNVVAPTELASSASLAAPDQAWPEEAWWRVYGDPQLNDLIGEGLAGSPSLAIAAARVRQVSDGMGFVTEGEGSTRSKPGSAVCLGKLMSMRAGRSS
jgi:hypothetical protein